MSGWREIVEKTPYAPQLRADLEGQIDFYRCRCTPDEVTALVAALPLLADGNAAERCVS